MNETVVVFRGDCTSHLERSLVNIHGRVPRTVEKDSTGTLHGICQCRGVRGELKVDARTSGNTVGDPK